MKTTDMKKPILLLVLSLMTAVLGGCSAGYNPIKHVDITVHISPGHTDREPVSDETILKSAEKARIADPWGETQSLSVVSEWVGFDFTPPAEEITLDNGRVISLTTYRYMTGTAEALYRSDDHELVFRQSRDLAGTALSEDHNTYMSEWDEDIEGYRVHCFGNAEYINMAYYDTLEGHFSVTYHCSGSDEGLTRADLSRIIPDLRA